MGQYVETIQENGYLCISKPIQKECGTLSAIMLAFLGSCYEYFEANNMLDKDGYFFFQQDRIESETGLSPYEQRKGLEKLIGNGIVKCKRKGSPCKKYYAIDFQLLKILITSNKNFSELDVKKIDNITRTEESKTIIIKNRDSNIVSNSDELLMCVSDAEDKKLLSRVEKAYLDVLNNNELLLVFRFFRMFLGYRSHYRKDDYFPTVREMAKLKETIVWAKENEYLSKDMLDDILVEYFQAKGSRFNPMYISHIINYDLFRGLVLNITHETWLWEELKDVHEGFKDYCM